MFNLPQTLTNKIIKPTLEKMYYAYKGVMFQNLTFAVMKF